MRDLLKRPITMGEIEGCLMAFAEECDQEERCGDMRPLLLTEVDKSVRSQHNCMFLPNEDGVTESFSAPTPAEIDTELSDRPIALQRHSER